MRYLISSILLLLAAVTAKGEENLITSYFWFDQDAPHITVQGNDPGLQLDVSGLSEGLHTLSHVAVTSDGRMTPPVSSTFLRLPDIYSQDVIDCYAVIDNSLSVRYAASVKGSAVHLDLDMSTLTDGLHQLTVYMNKAGSQTIIGPAAAYFLKAPSGLNDIIQYRYWINNDFENAVTVECDKPDSPFQIATMIDVREYPLRSDNFDVEIKQDGGLSMFARNTFNLFAMDATGRFTPAHTAEYTDRRTHVEVPLTSIEELTTCADKNVGTIDDGDVRWFRFYGEIGDSIALNLSDAASYELYSPSSRLLMKNKSATARATATKILDETGMHYLAIHNIASSIKTRLRLNFTHIPRNTILAVTPPEMPVPYVFAKIDIYGNGMSDAKKLVLISADGNRIETDNITSYDNYNLSCVFDNGISIPSGIYDVAVTVDDRLSGQEVEIVKEKALTVTDASAPADGQPEISVEVIPSGKASTPYMVDIVVTNESDEPCWGIPFNIACERNGGKVGYVFYMRDFLGNNVDLAGLEYIDTDNLLGTGVDGLYFPLVLDFMHPHESRVLKTGIISEAHEHIGLYAWAGEPYSSEQRRLLSLSPEELYELPVLQSNIMSTLFGAYMIEVADMINNNYMMRRIARARDDDNHVLEILQEVTPEVIGSYEHFSGAANNASTLSNLAQAQGMTFAGISNAGGSVRAYLYFKDNHIPGETLREQLENIDLMYSSGIPPEFMPYYQEAKRNMARAASPGDIVETATDIPFIGTVIDFFTGRSAACPDPATTRHDIECLKSFDPNAITGYSDPTGGPYIGLDIRRLTYEVEFENDPANANVSASNVCVSTEFNSGIFDLKSFAPQSVEIGGRTIMLTGEQNFVKTVDMRPDIQCVVEIELVYSSDNGNALWTFRSLDPVSLEPIENSRFGFLPVNDDTGAGTGRICYTVRLNEGLNDNMHFSHKASIKFDDNNPIETSPWTNILDYVRPTSRVVSVRHDENSHDYVFEVSSEDNGSGILSYDLYARTSATAPWSVVKTAIDGDFVEYTADTDDNPEFMVLATDRAGNRQITPGTTSSGIENIIDSYPPDNAEIWYDIHGIKQNGSSRPTTRIIISTKGKKVMIR